MWSVLSLQQDVLSGMIGLRVHYHAALVSKDEQEDATVQNASAIRSKRNVVQLNFVRVNASDEKTQIMKIYIWFIEYLSYLI